MKYSMVKKKKIKNVQVALGRFGKNGVIKAARITDSPRMMLTSLTRALGKNRVLTSILHQTFPYIRAKNIFSV